VLVRRLPRISNRELKRRRRRVPEGSRAMMAVFSISNRELKLYGNTGVYGDGRLHPVTASQIEN
jgi:hypothetical protein